MEEIEYNIKIRKVYSSKLCEFYNYIKEKIDKNNQFNFNVLELLEEEKQIWDKWQSKITKMKSFNDEIGFLINKKDQKYPFNPEKKKEIEYIQRSFEKQIQDSKNHYSIFFKKMESTRNSWLNEIIYEYISYSNKQKYLIELSNKIQEVYPQFRNICEDWNSASIEKAQDTLFHISEVEMFCQSMLHEFEQLTGHEDKMDNPASKNQLNILVKQCEELSLLLENFFNNYNIFELLEKLKNEDSQLFKDKFKDIFGSKGIKKIRTTIKLVLDEEETKKNVQIIYNTFKKLQLIIQPEMKKLQDKKYKLLTLCCNSSEINRISTEKWVIENYSHIFGPLDIIIENRNKFI